MNERIREVIAEEFHKAWMDWTKTISKQEKIDPVRLNRWQFFWTIPYLKLEEKDKAPEYAHAEAIMKKLGLY